MSDCRHERLHFGSGGFYVFCRDCHVAWVARKLGSDEIDYTRSSHRLGTEDYRDARAAIIEECARVAEPMKFSTAEEIAAAIRARKNEP